MFQARSTQFRENMTWNSQTQGWIFQPKFFWEWFGWIWYFFSKKIYHLEPKSPWVFFDLRLCVRAICHVRLRGLIWFVFIWPSLILISGRAPDLGHRIIPRTHPIGSQLISDWFLSNLTRRSVLWISFLGWCREILASDSTYHPCGHRMSDPKFWSQVFAGLLEAFVNLNSRFLKSLGYKSCREKKLIPLYSIKNEIWGLQTPKKISSRRILKTQGEIFFIVNLKSANSEGWISARMHSESTSRPPLLSVPAQNDRTYPRNRADHRRGTLLT